jgi:hypothetical protein
VFQNALFGFDFSEILAMLALMRSTAYNYPSLQNRIPGCAKAGARLGSFIIPAFAAALLASRLTCGAVTYDPSADFSILSNPNGVWSYGNSTTLGGAMISHPGSTPNALNLGLYSWHAISSGQPLPSIVFNPHPTTVVYSGSSDNIVWTPRAISLHPGPNGEFSILRFTAPQGGLFRIQGLFYSVDQYYGATTDVHILKNGQSLFDDTITGKTDVSNFDASLNAVVGDTFDFVVGSYTYGHGWDSTGIQLTITIVPEPSAMALIGLGTLMVAVNARTRGKGI